MVMSALELSVVEHWALGTVGVGTTVDVESVCVGKMGTFMVDTVGVGAAGAGALGTVRRC